MRRPWHGFTLAEMLIAMGLMALLLGTMAILFRTGLSNVTTTSTQTENVQIARVALETMLAEYRQSLELLEPSPAGPVTAPVLHFRRLSPDQSTSDFHVKYRLSRLTLYRKTWTGPGSTEPPDDDATVEALFGGIQGLQVRTTAGPPRRVEISLTASLTGNQLLGASLSGTSAERVGQ